MQVIQAPTVGTGYYVRWQRPTCSGTRPSPLEYAATLSDARKLARQAIAGGAISVVILQPLEYYRKEPV